MDNDASEEDHIARFVDYYDQWLKYFAVLHHSFFRKAIQMDLIAKTLKLQYKLSKNNSKYSDLNEILSLIY